MKDPELDDAGRAVPRAPWVRPALTAIGDVKDLVRGSTKQSGQADSDGTSVRKPPLIS